AAGVAAAIAALDQERAGVDDDLAGVLQDRVDGGGTGAGGFLQRAGVLERGGREIADRNGDGAFQVIEAAGQDADRGPIGKRQAAQLMNGATDQERAGVEDGAVDRRGYAARDAQGAGGAER